MDIKSLEIKNKYYYNWDDIVYIYDFDEKSVKITKRESRIDANIYYIGYVFKNDIIKLFYLTVNRLFGHIEKINGSNDRCLVVNKNDEKVINIFGELWKFFENKINAVDKISKYNKLRFSSDLNLPLNTLIQFRTLTIHINRVIEKDGKYYPEIYLDEALYVQNIK